MNALLLMGIVLLVFIMGYRFYAKFLVLGVFRTENDVLTPARQRGDTLDFSPCNRWLLLGHNAAANIGILSITGIGVAIVWGWIPAFLWVVVGTLVAGGTYALGALWASLRQGGNSLAGIVFDMVGAWAALPLFFLGAFILVFLTALTCVLLGQLLQAHPEAAWVFFSMIFIPPLIRRSLSSRSVAGKLMWVFAVVVILAAGTILGQEYPLRFSGTSTLDINGIGVFRIAQETPWVAIALALAYHSIRAPVSAIARPRGVLVAVLLVTLMLLTGAGLLLAAPSITAPDFNIDAGLPNVFPLLFLVVSGGAISGVYALIVTGTTVRQVEQSQHAPTISYGSVMLDGVLAALLVVVLSAGFATTGEWSTMYGQWPVKAEIFSWLDLAVTKLGRFVASTGIPMPIAIGIVASTVAAMALTMLENSLRALSFGVEEFVEDFDLENLKGNRLRQRIAVGIVIFATICLLQVDLGVDHWLFFGLANQLFAGCFMLVLSLIVLRSSSGTLFVLLPALFVLGCASWGLVWLVIDWWQKEEWILFIMTCFVGAAAITSVFACACALLKVHQHNTATPP
jgi:carbon starvation protein